MQKKKNIRLAVTLVVMIIITIVTYILVQPNTGLDVDRGLFAVENTLEVDKVTLEDANQVALTFERNQWRVNNQYDADPQRINVLFAILQQVRVRRPVAITQRDSVNEKFTTSGTKVKLYANGQIVNEFEVLGDEQKSLTYMRLNDDQTYLVEIPGYKSYLAGIFNLDKNGWRNPLVFQLNWANLLSVSLSYPESSNNDLVINFEDRYLALKGVENADSTKLGNLIDDISLFYVNDYLNEDEVDRSKVDEYQALIEVKDIAGNNYSLTVCEEASPSEYFVFVDSTDYAIIEKQLVNRVTKPKAYFSSSR